MRTESLFRPDAISLAGARGLMQLMPNTARWIGRESKNGRFHANRYRSSKSNIWLGSWYIKNLLIRYEGDLVDAIGAYNAGPEAIDRWRKDYASLEPDEMAERTPYDETKRYVRKVLESYLVYQKLYAGPRRVILSSAM